MQEIGHGIYRGLLIVPISAPIHDFNLFVVAEKYGQEIRKGGEFSSKITVRPAVILMTIENPKRFSFELGKPINFEIKANYLDKSKLVEGKVFLWVADDKIELVENSGAVFSGSFIPLEKSSNVEKLKITVQDKYQNSAEIEKNIVFSNGLFVNVYNYFVVFLVFGIVLLAISKFALPKIKHRINILKKPSAEKEIKEKIKKIQIKYYNEQSITKKEYSEKLSKFQKELDETKNL